MSSDHQKFLNEDVYRTTLTNGLQLVLLPKPDYHETFGMMVTKFGSLDTIFRPKNRKKQQQFPSGIAHFLEHTLFEMKDGQDAMQIFARLGADANAFTALNHTAYYFSATDSILESLEILQRFTASHQFTNDSLVKEKDIIEQEIEMYQDDPDYQIYLSTLAQLYPDTPLAQDIAGDTASVRAITANHLQACFDIFYQPSNMLLVLAGNFNPDDILAAVQTYQTKRRVKKEQPIERGIFLPSPVKRSSSRGMLVAGSKLGVGLRGNSKLTDLSLSFYRLCLRLLFSMLLGSTSSVYQEWYQKGRIDDSFDMEIEVSTTYCFVIITLNTAEPMAMSKRIRRLIKDFEASQDISQDHLDLVKKAFYGDFVKSMNRLDLMATQYASAWADGEDLFAFPALLSEISLADILTIGRDFILESDMTDFIIFPK